MKNTEIHAWLGALRLQNRRAAAVCHNLNLYETIYRAGGDNYTLLYIASILSLCLCALICAFALII
jgi:ABC-type uncharacterized transport system permease subunit